jgi:putative intracellular protease/amidase
MLVFRSFVVGLLGAGCLLLATRPPTRVIAKTIYRAGPPVATIVDVAAGLPSAQLGGLVHLERGEHVLAVDDHPVWSDLDAGALLALIDHPGNDPRPSFVDLDIAGGPAGQRRVVLLLH